jgi:glycosyltransferase involved in cell wall biosynthesis
VAILFYRFGPYHHARLKSASARLKVTAVEFSNVDPTYAWDVIEGQEGFDRMTLFPGSAAESQPARRVFQVVNQTLNQLRPAAVAVPGWYDRCSLAALKWCTTNSVPAILMSESSAWDEKRTTLRELVKSRLVRLCAAGLVGGKSHADYLTELGMPPERIFLGYDAVDNRYFENKAAKIKNQKSEIRNKYGLPENFFLASARFVEKKNLLRLFQAFALYREKAESRKQKVGSLGEKVENRNQALDLCPPPSAPWSLVLLGDGPLKSDLCRLISDLRLDACVHLPGFKQYHELPVYYGLASAFVHASTTEQWGLVVNEAMASGLPVLVSSRCGCAQDLVQEGKNGFTFDPFDVEQLAQLMFQISAFQPFRLSAFGDASRELISHWGAAAFGKGLSDAVAAAMQQAPPQLTLSGRTCINALVHRVKALRSIDERAAEAGEARTEPSDDYLLYSFAGRKVLAVPRHPRTLRRVAISRYQPFTVRRRLYSGILQTAAMTRSELAFARNWPSSLTDELGFSYRRWMDLLSHHLGFFRVYSVLAWPSQPTRQRFYVHFLSEDLNPVAFVKVAARVEEGVCLEREAAALHELGRQRFRGIRLPRVLGHGKIENNCFLALEPLPAKARPPRFNRNSDVSELLARIAGPHRRLSAEEITGLSWWSEYGARLNASHRLFHSELTRLLPLGAEVCRAHGDMGLSNMAQDTESLWLFDWETTHTAAPAMTDRACFFLSFNIGKVASRPETCLREFQSRFLLKASPQQKLDIMLVLAFRFASNTGAAEFYIRNWNRLSRHPQP